jgi:peptidoglycan/LPS O-acetylase OafA/YrhL
MEGGKDRIEYLDSVRGLAAMFVFFGHFMYQYNLQFTYPLLIKTPLVTFYNAVPAVSIFLF